MKYMYMVMDGRAAFDTDTALVLECVGEVSEKEARKVLLEGWEHTDSMLVRYEQEDGMDSELDPWINETVLFEDIT